eukprot:scaffold188655_cov35-Tisochrysis_lutea.AAC.2
MTRETDGTRGTLAKGEFRDQILHAHALLSLSSSLALQVEAELRKCKQPFSRPSDALWGLAWQRRRVSSRPELCRKQRVARHEQGAEQGANPGLGYFFRNEGRTTALGSQRRGGSDQVYLEGCGWLLSVRWHAQPMAIDA